MRRLDGKVVVVTGASRGIGAEIARLFAAEGGRVICAARTLREGDHQLAGSLETTVASIRAASGRTLDRMPLTNPSTPPRRRDGRAMSARNRRSCGAASCS